MQPVPELTRSAGIQLNKRVSLRRQQIELRCFTGQFPQRPGRPRSKAVTRHTPLGGFVRGRPAGIADGSSRKKTKKGAYTQRARRAISCELQRLREKVRALEQSPSGQTAFGRPRGTVQSDAK